MVNFGKPKTSTRVGDEYQAIIPPLMEEYKPSSDLMRFAYGLPIPVTWTEQAAEANKPDESAMADGEKEPKLKTKDTELIPLPGVLFESWSAIEHDSFLLGLYLFEKNFTLLERFVGSKKRGTVIDYYYGEFYNSGAHKSWSKWRTERRNRPLNARKLFMGWILEELMSRLCSNVTDEVLKDRLIKDGTKYIEGRLSLPRFVFNLKQNVGMNLLVEAVAIGQEDRDLLELRPIGDFSYGGLEVPAVPTANTRSSLTPQEIVKILNGDARLSKTKSSELFWDEVWPRLLARGWNSEQPIGRNFLQYPKNLVFLVPGVAEFSSNELTKGTHYFDSLTDVLSKVALEPELLELESDLDEPVDLDAYAEHDQDDLEPDVHQNDQDSKMFLIVDTSLDCKDGIFKWMELPTYTVEEGTEHMDSLEQDVPQSNLDPKLFTIVDASLNRANDGVFKLMEIPSSPVFEPAYVVEKELNELDLKSENEETVQEPQSRRYSARNRTLSTKALEALAFGYVSPKKKLKKDRREDA